MILAALALVFVNGQDATQAPPPLTCSVLGTPAAAGGPSVDYAGVRYALCCAMCQASFQKDPKAAISSDKAKGKTIGVSLFDPISDARITGKQAKSWTDYHGVRYLFTSDDEKNTFTADPTKYTSAPSKEALYCPVQKTKLSGYAAAGSYRDYNGVRYYFCCGMCPTDFMKTPDDFVKVAADYVSEPKGIVPEVKKADPAADFQAETFACKHCGRQMSINSPDDLASVCSACNCGHKGADCKPQNK